MKRCPNCNRVYSDMVTVCSVCQTNLNVNLSDGANQKQDNYIGVSQTAQTTANTQQNSQEKGNWLWILPGLLLPLAGLIAWLCLKNKNPASAKIALRGALIGFFLNIALRFIV